LRVVLRRGVGLTLPLRRRLPGRRLLRGRWLVGRRLLAVALVRRLARVGPAARRLPGGGAVLVLLVLPALTRLRVRRLSGRALPVLRRAAPARLGRRGLPGRPAPVVVLAPPDTPASAPLL